MTLAELETAFTQINLSKYDNTRLDKCTVILNAKKFVEVNLLTLKNGSKNRAYLPYWNRLINFYNIIKNEN